ncbi:hypothetical protein Bca52824_011340 [Brassica carinata]|uniref:Uncharacterized protein n=1 Tax=Brassica carinata TaxID=52824 RepID=A0A8X8BBK2_BRACI|nr:hypothetical protein Bca52824_011340 [Brassica carinata]
MEDFNVLPSPILADLFQPQEFDQTVPDMFPTPIIISDDDTEIDDMVAPAPIIILSDDDSETDDIVPEVPLGHPSSITISSSGTSGETLGDDFSEDHSSPPAPGVGMPSGSHPLVAFDLPISPMSPGLLDTTSIMIDLHHEFMIGWEALYYQSMEIMVDSDDDPLVHYADLMLSDEPYTQPMEPANYQPMEPTYYQPMEPAHYQPMEPAHYQPMEPAHYQPINEIGEPSSFPAKETATAELPHYSTIYETGGPPTFPAVGSAYVPGGSTPYGDPYATQSYYYGQGSDMFGDVGDGYVDPHGYPYHTVTYLGGPNLHPRCLACRGIGHLTGMCPRYDELSGIPYLHSVQPAGESSE